MVFVEMDRNDALLNNLFELVDDIPSKRKVTMESKILLSEDPASLDMEVLTGLVAQDPTIQNKRRIRRTIRTR